MKSRNPISLVPIDSPRTIMHNSTGLFATQRHRLFFGLPMLIEVQGLVEVQGRSRCYCSSLRMVVKIGVYPVCRTLGLDYYLVCTQIAL